MAGLLQHVRCALFSGIHELGLRACLWRISVKVCTEDMVHESGMGGKHYEDLRNYRKT